MLGDDKITITFLGATEAENTTEVIDNDRGFEEDEETTFRGKRYWVEYVSSQPHKWIDRDFTPSFQVHLRPIESPE